jgi:hypothetical protein
MDVYTNDLLSLNNFIPRSSYYIYKGDSPDHGITGVCKNNSIVIIFKDPVNIYNEDYEKLNSKMVEKNEYTVSSSNDLTYIESHLLYSEIGTTQGPVLETGYRAGEMPDMTCQLIENNEEDEYKDKEQENIDWVKSSMGPIKDRFMKMLTGMGPFLIIIALIFILNFGINFFVSTIPNLMKNRNTVPQAMGNSNLGL